mgnify:FL=1
MDTNGRNWLPRFVAMTTIDPDTLADLPEVVIARVEPNGTLKVAYSGSMCIGGHLNLGQVKAAMKSMPWPEGV